MSLEYTQPDGTPGDGLTGLLESTASTMTPFASLFTTIPIKIFSLQIIVKS